MKYTITITQIHEANDYKYIRFNVRENKYRFISADYYMITDLSNNIIQIKEYLLNDKELINSLKKLGYSAKLFK